MKASDFAPKKIIDQKSETVEELKIYWGISRRWMREKASEYVKNGEWERVWKRIDGKLIPAYRARILAKRKKE